MLHLARDAYLAMVAHCLDGLPDEACGLLAGAGPGDARRCYPAANTEASARVYTLDPRDHLRADRDSEAAGLQITAVFHSHTHTAAYPSPTDVSSAPDPQWSYVIVSLRDAAPVVRCFRLAGGKIDEEPVVLVDGQEEAQKP